MPLSLRTAVAVADVLTARHARRVITDPVEYLYRMRIAKILATEALALAVAGRILVWLIASQY
jgi:hypothetical protein